MAYHYFPPKQRSFLASRGESKSPALRERWHWQGRKKYLQRDRYSLSLISFFSPSSSPIEGMVRTKPSPSGEGRAGSRCALCLVPRSLTILYSNATKKTPECLLILRFSYFRSKTTFDTPSAVMIEIQCALICLVIR